MMPDNDEEPTRIEMPADTIFHEPEDPYAEVRDPDSGEVIFPAVKRPFKLIQGDKP